MKSSDPVFEFLLKCFGQRDTVTVPRSLISLTGDIKSALLLSQIIHWSRINADKDGWFYKTYEDWLDEIALSKHEVARSVEQLVEEETVETRVAKVNGTPKVHYRFLTSGFRKWIVKKGEVDSEKTGSQIVKKGEVLYKEQNNTTEEYVQKETGGDLSLETKPEVQTITPAIVPSLLSGPILDEYANIDPETGEEYQTPSARKPYKKKWGPTKPEKPHAKSDSIRAMREAQYASAQVSSPSIAAVVSDDGRSSTFAAVPFPVRWNALVPERTVDPALLSSCPAAYRNPVFSQRFDDICRDAKKLIASGADITFGFLLSVDKNTDQYRWQQLLGGQLDWLKPKSKNKAKEETERREEFKKALGL